MIGMTQRKTAQNRLNRDLRKAVHSGDGYDDYMRIYQFLRQKQNIVNERMRIMRHRIDDFYNDGGTVTEGDGSFTVSLSGVSVHIGFDVEGDVSSYKVDGMKGKRDTVERILSLFFCLHMMPVYRHILETTMEQIADMDNDNVLRGLSEIRELIRGDRYLTASSIAGTELRSEDDIPDPFGIYGEEG